MINRRLYYTDRYISSLTLFDVFLVVAAMFPDVAGVLSEIAGMLRGVNAAGTEIAGALRGVNAAGTDIVGALRGENEAGTDVAVALREIAGLLSGVSNSGRAVNACIKPKTALQYEKA